MKTLPLAGLVLALLVPLPVVAAEKDPNTGLIMAEGWETVRNNCTACHSAGLVTQNSGSRNYWLNLIRWMQATQNLWQFDTATEKTILDYLSTQYGVKEGARREPLPRELMPENPYKADAKSS
ncbi:hypothetical protein [Marinobacterium sediminicola]|uniref:Sulfite dehydrogenase (Cytochrome) subunit SorB n=1 Tax=Marinobacterium sediminicola TaxID=518898 RepID=A0ABY1S2S8_9GAMM|nr:hypothetical protein [Marinobacterium sediminicola]ULG70699.1 hypothetical protein LN244_07795 [Marinobacterium sediminicola]SMR77248.1 hypothetical protein SAMN04487964_11360 [Marinobacterium sediminicola]